MAGPQVTDNDALFGILWVLYAILAGAPLPGQACPLEVGMIATDFINNGLPPGFLPANFWGNTVSSQSVSAHRGAYFVLLCNCVHPWSSMRV